MKKIGKNSEIPISSIEDPLNPDEDFHHNPLDDSSIENLQSQQLKSQLQLGESESEATVENHTSPENERLGGHKPLRTIINLLAGPLLSQVTNALFGIITTMWVAKALGEDGVAAVSVMNAFDGIGRSFGFFVSVAASTQISALYGKGLSQDAGQLIADLIRMCFVCGLIVPAILLPILKPSGRWFGADENIVQLGFDYMMPMACFSTTTCLYVATGGFLQGEGRTFQFGLLNMVNLCLNMLVLDPLFLFAFKMGIRGASIATVLSEIVPSFVVLALFYMKKFGVKPTFDQLLKKFGPHTFQSLKVGFSQLISQLSICVPSVLVRKIMGMCVSKDSAAGEFTNIMAGFNAAIRLNGLSMSIFMAVTQALIPAASYAYAAKKYRRFLWLCFHSLWMNFAWGSITMLFNMTIPREMSKAFGSGEAYLNYAEKMIRLISCVAPIGGIRNNAQAFCQAMQLGTRATIMSFFNNFIAITAAAFILYYTNKHDSARIILCYPISYGASVFVSLATLWSPVKRTIKLAKEEEEGVERKEIEEGDEIQNNADMENDVNGNRAIGINEGEKELDDLNNVDVNVIGNGMIDSGLLIKNDNDNSDGINEALNIKEV